MGTTLKALRKMRGMTQQQVSDATGLSRTSITNIESGRQTVTLENLMKIARALGFEARLHFIPLKPELV
jgi:transcriptional regulator with XRE-family HTH domain